MHLERLVDRENPESRSDDRDPAKRSRAARRAGIQDPERQNEWEETFNAIRDPITIYDENRKVVAANRAAREMFDLGRDHPDIEAPSVDP